MHHTTNCVAFGISSNTKERDLAIRFRPNLSARELVDAVQSVMRLTGTEIGRVHAVLDVGYVEDVREHRVGAVAEAAAAVADLLGPARTCSDLLGPGATTLLAGSIPANRTTYATISRDRSEVSLWNEVRHRGAGEIGYGDYGVAHPIPKSGENARER